MREAPFNVSVLVGLLYGLFCGSDGFHAARRLPPRRLRVGE